MNLLLTIWAGDQNNKSPFLNDYVGGVEIDVRNLATGLAHKGHTVHFLCLAGEPFDGSIDGVHVHHVKQPLRSRYNQLNFYIQEATYRHAVRDCCRRNNIQIVNPHLIYPCATTIWLATRGLPTHVVPTISSRDFVALAFSPSGTDKAYLLENIPLLRYRLRLIRRILERSTRLVTIAEHLNDDVRSITPNAAPIHMIPPGVDSARFTNIRDELRTSDEKRDGGLNFVFTARFDLPKRHDLIIHAFALVLPSYPRANLYLVGEGSRRGEMERLATSLGIRDKVHFCGRLGNDEVARFLPTMDVFVFACDSEGLPKAVVEALACELPVIASNIPPMPCLVTSGTNGCLTKNDAVDFATAMKSVLANPQLLAEWRRAARLEARFHLTTMIKDYEALFAMIIGNDLASRSPIRESCE